MSDPKPHESTPLNYVDCECTTDQDKRLHQVSGFVAGLAFNELCHMIGGNFPDLRMQEEAPVAFSFFMKLFGEVSATGPWISVEDRLPEDGQGVLCYTDGRVLFSHNWWHHSVCLFRDGEFQSGSRRHPTHWAPLPPPPTVAAIEEAE